MRRNGAYPMPLEPPGRPFENAKIQISSLEAEIITASL